MLAPLAPSLSFLLLGNPLTSGSAGPEGPDLTRYFTVCALLLVTIGGLAFGFRRLVGGAIKAKAAKRSLQVLDILPLGGKHKLAVVRCYDRAFVLGLGEKEVSLVAELDPSYAESAVHPPAAEKTFATMLAGARPRMPRAEREAAAERFKAGGLVG